MYSNTATLEEKVSWIGLFRGLIPSAMDIRALYRRHSLSCVWTEMMCCRQHWEDDHIAQRSYHPRCKQLMTPMLRSHLHQRFAPAN